MLFNSFVFLVFFAGFYNTYLHCMRWRRAQNALLLAGSYLFYGWWDWRFLGLLLLSTVIDFSVAQALSRSSEAGRRKLLVGLSVASNLSILGFFKYFNFFADTLVTTLAGVGLQLDAVTLEVILPVGISFYTFQTLSYTIDVYRRRMEATDSLLNFAVFVAFFPQLVAGPIERAQRFLPQVAAPRVITARNIDEGVFLLIWGLFKKMVIADNAAIIANEVFNNYQEHSGLILLVGALAFTLQIYCDFSGYSDIARGLSKLMGFELMVNFKLPYFARTPSEFWLRWHVSLSSWLRDYLYISLGGNRGTPWLTYRNLCLTMLLGGLWHGAAWNFVAWGAFHGAILVVYRALGVTHQRVAQMPWIANLAAWGVMFGLTVFGWILFRARSLDQITHFVTQMGLEVSDQCATLAWDLAVFWAPLLVVQFWQLHRNDLLIIPKMPLVVRSVTYALLICGLMVFGAGESQEFIYFQF